MFTLILSLFVFEEIEVKLMEQFTWTLSRKLFQSKHIRNNGEICQYNKRMGKLGLVWDSRPIISTFSLKS